MGWHYLAAEAQEKQEFREIPSIQTELSRRMYRRNLPHWYPAGAAVFVTWRLFGTLPPHSSLERAKDGGAFAMFDCIMARAQSGPAWLQAPDVADVVSRVIEAPDADRQLCRLHSFVVMPNHVHMSIIAISAFARGDELD